MFEAEKLLSTKISFRPSFCLDSKGFDPGNTAYCIRTGPFATYLAVLLNSSVSEYYSRKIFLGKQGGFYEVQPDGLEAFPVPKLGALEERLINEIDYSAIAGSDNRLEQLLNGFVYELFFKDDLHARGLTLFDEAERAGLGALTGLDGVGLVKAAQEFVDRVFQPSHPLYGMLFDLQALDVVRIIEGKE